MYISQNIQQVFPIYMQSKQDILMLKKDNNTLEYFGPYKDGKYILDQHDIEKNHNNLVGQSSDTGSCAKNNLSELNLQDKFLASESLLFL